jgi:hypothetical protein
MDASPARVHKSIRSYGLRHPSLPLSCPSMPVFYHMLPSEDDSSDKTHIGPRPLLHCAKICYTTKYKGFLILCEYMCRRRQQGLKRREWVSGLDLGRICSYSSCSGHSVHCLMLAHSSVRARRSLFGPGISPCLSETTMRGSSVPNPSPVCKNLEYT